MIASVAAAWEQAVQQQEQAPSDLPLAETDCIEGAEREALTVEAAVTVDSANQSTAVLVTPPPSAEPAAAAELRVSSFNMLQRQRRAAAKQVRRRSSMRQTVVQDTAVDVGTTIDPPAVQQRMDVAAVHVTLLQV